MQNKFSFVLLFLFIAAFAFSILGKNTTLVFVLLFLLGGLVVYVISLYNKIKSEQIKIFEARANIDVYLQQRYEEISAVYKIVQEFKLHELTVFKEIVKLRQMAVSDQYSPEQKNAINNQLERKIPSMLATFESYPELRSNQNFIQLQEAISDNEDNIAAARSSYNGYVNRYNTSIALFPAVLIANQFNFQAALLYEAPADKKENPLL